MSKWLSEVLPFVILNSLLGDACVLNYTFGVPVLACVELGVLGQRLFGVNRGLKYFCETLFEETLDKHLDAGVSWRDALTVERAHCKSTHHLNLDVLTSLNLRKMPDSMLIVR